MTTKIGSNKPISQRKLNYSAKLKALLDEYDSFLIISINNINTKQIDELRKYFRGRARFLFGKNTLIRKIVRDYIKQTGNTKLLNLLAAIKGNCGFLFSKESMSKLRKEILQRKTQYAAKCGCIAPVDVYVVPGPTGCDPSDLQLFQTLDIPTRMNRGQLDIEEEIYLLHKGERIGEYEALLLNKLDMKPFYRGIEIENMYDAGHWEYQHYKYADKITIRDIALSLYLDAFNAKNICACCYMQYPPISNIPKEVLNAYKYVLGFGLELDTYSWSNLKEIKDLIITFIIRKYAGYNGSIDCYQISKLLVFGYIRKIEKRVLHQTVIPMEIFALCFEYYFYEKPPELTDINTPKTSSSHNGNLFGSDDSSLSSSEDCITYH